MASSICSIRGRFICCKKPARNNDYQTFKEYTRLIDDQSERMATLRGLMAFKYVDKPIPIEEVEPVDAIVKRFKTGAMSYGSISKEAHEAWRSR